MARRHVYGGAIALTGAVLSVVQVVHGLQQTNRPIVLLFETVPFALVALALVYVGYWLSRQPSLEPDMARVVAWGVGSTVLFASIAALFLFSQEVEMGTLQRATYIATDNITIGAVVGALVGLYDARSRRHLRDLEAERDRVESFAKKAADVNNYGRALNRSTTVEEVSALCIQAMGTLVDLSDVAFARTDGETVELVDNTIVNVQQEGLADLVELGLDGDVTDVRLVDDLPEAVADHAAAALVVRLTEGSEDVVLVALAPDELDIRDEDVELLEMLFAHAATALSTLETEPLGAASTE